MNPYHKKVVLLAEDDPDDEMFARRAMTDCQAQARLEVVHDGEELLQYLRREGPYAGAPTPDVILLDLNMPRMSGREALREIKKDPTLRRIPIIVLTTSEAHLDVVDCYDQGTNAYVVKPVNYTGMCEAMSVLGQFWFKTARLAPQDE